MTTLLLLVLLAQSTPGSQQPPAVPGNIDGFVVEAGTGRPLAKAQVTLSRVGTRGQAQAVTTNSSGRFIFQNIEPGQYRLAAIRNGYVRTEYGQRSLNRPGLPLTVTSGRTVQDVLLGLIPASTIAGHVFDRDGEPLAGVNVQAFKYVYQNGERVLSSVQQARTNDLGEYRLYWLNPGQYYISATHNAGAAGILTAVAQAAGGALAATNPGPQGPGVPGAPGDGRIRAAIEAAAGQLGQLGGGRVAALLADQPSQGDETYIPVYYPGTTDVETAAPINLQPGNIFSGIDLTVTQVPTLRVRGQAIGPNGQPAPEAQVMLIPRQRIGIAMGNRFRARNMSPQGTFEIRGVVPGSYDLVAVMNDRTSRTSARVSLDIGNADIDNVSLVLAPGFMISGRLVMEGMPANTDIQRLRVALNSSSPLPGIPGPGGGGGRRGENGNSGTVNADGTFVLQNIGPGDYRVLVQGLPRNAYIRIARFGATDALREGLMLNGQPTGSLEILVSARTGIIDGVVLDEKRNASANTQVVLVPDATRRGRGDLYRSVTSDAAGKFRIEGVPPGDYKLFAWEDVETGAWQDPTFLLRYEETGRGVRIPENGEITAELQVIPEGVR